MRKITLEDKLIPILFNMALNSLIGSIADPALFFL